MTRRTVGLDERIQRYIQCQSAQEPEVLARLADATARLPDADMQIGPEQGRLMALLVEITGAREILEIGCFTGYSALWMALAMPPDGRLTTLDVNADTVEIGRAAWREAGIAERIEVRLGLALDSLDQLLAEGRQGSFDLVFVDADKKFYDAYYERALTLVRAGGLVLLDNMLWGGAVADPADTDRQTGALRALATKIRDDPRVSATLLPVGDGLTLARRR